MKNVLRLVGLGVAAIALAGCNPGPEGVGNPSTSTGPGGEDAGPTGTDSGSGPALNPAAETPGANGTGTN
jgi:hypothetical protein